MTVTNDYFEAIPIPRSRAGDVNDINEQFARLQTAFDIAQIDIAAGGGGGVTDGDKGDIVVSGSGSSWAIDPTVATTTGRSLMASASTIAARSALGLGTAATSASTDFAPASHTHPASQISDSTTTGRALLTTTDAAAARTTLALGTAALSAATAFAAATHAHAIADVTGLQGALDGKQVAGSYAAAVHTHAIADTTGLQGALDAKQPAGSYAAATHTHVATAISDSTATGRSLLTTTDAASARTTLGLGTAALSAATAFAAATHSHAIADVTGLQTALDGKAPTSHTHTASQISDATTAGRSMLTAADVAAQTALLNAATTSLKGLMSSADKTKLDGVATGATANSTDASLRDRSTHTGTQAASTVSDFTSAARAQVEAALVAGTNITLTPSGTGATRQITIAAAGGGAGTNLAYTAATRLLESDTGTDVTLPLVTSGAAGLAPASGGGSVNFLRADGTWATPAGGSGAALVEAYGRLAANYTLTSSTTQQKLFNWSTNGAVALATGYYVYDMMVSITTMSATSGNGIVSLKGGGTAVLDFVRQNHMGIDSAGGVGNAPATWSGGMSSATSGSYGGATATAAVNTNLLFRGGGHFDVTTAGTLIPSITLSAASAAVVEAGSYFYCRRIGDTGVATAGTWT